MLRIIKNIEGFYLKDELWGGALDTLLMVLEHEKFHELIYLLEQLYPEPVDIVVINDLLWFNSDYICEQLQMRSR